MKHKGLFITILIFLLLSIAVVIFVKINKGKNINHNNTSAEITSSVSDLQSKEQSNDSNGAEAMRSTGIHNKETASEMNENWEKIYMGFVKEEKDNPSFTLTKFEYTFVSINDFEVPLLLIHDDWNMYLFYQKNNIVHQAYGLNGETLALSRMDDAYINDGILYLEGACGSPKSFYLCKVVFDDFFSLEYLAEGNYTSSGKIVYHDNQGNAISKDTYTEVRNNALYKARKVTFLQ